MHLASVALGNGTPEYPQGDVVSAVEEWQPNAVEIVSPDETAAIMRKLAGGEGRESEQALGWAGYAVAEVLREDVEPKGSSRGTRSAEQNAARQRVAGVLALLCRSGALKTEHRKDEKSQLRPCLVPVLRGAFDKISAPSPPAVGMGGEGAE